MTDRIDKDLDSLMEEGSGEQVVLQDSLFLVPRMVVSKMIQDSFERGLVYGFTGALLIGLLGWAVVTAL